MRLLTYLSYIIKWQILFKNGGLDLAYQNRNCPYRFGQKSNAALAAVVVHVALLLTHPALGSCLHPLVLYAILYTAFTYKYVSNIGPRLLIHFSGLEEILGFWECEHRPYQWPLVPICTSGNSASTNSIRKAKVQSYP